MKIQHILWLFAATILTCLCIRLISCDTTVVEPDRTYFENIIVKDLDGDEVKDILSFRSEKARRFTDDPWVANYIKNCRSSWWNSITILKGGTNVKEALFVTPIHWCSDHPITEHGTDEHGAVWIYDGKRRYLKIKSGMLFLEEK